MMDPLPENGVSKPHTDHEHETSISHSVKQRRGSIDKDAQEMVIDSLRAQIQDLFSQVSQLNNKLVKSYDRVSDLEDDLHVASANVRTSSLKISQLELERTQHLSALNTGLLVEKSHVTTELNRLMEKATEEAAQRGQAESARMAIEKDLDDLSATLFGQANSMVAEARYDKHLSERKVEAAESALKSAEEAVQLMQAQMQAMLAEREEAEEKTREMEQVMGKGKWVQRRDSGVVLPPLRLLSAHAPHHEYLSFIAHLRVLHPSSPHSPAMSTLLQLPFLARLLTEDSEPTVRLDLAPSLNWLSRRSILTAIYSGQLTIEPVSATTLFAESSIYPTSTTIAGMNSTHDNISCALCGTSIFALSNDVTSPIRTSLSSLTHNYSTAWSSGSFFKKTNSSGSVDGTQPSTPTQSTHRTSIGAYLNSQIFIFRLASPPSTTISSLPIPSLTKSSSQSNSSPIPSNSYASSSYTGSITHSSTPNNQTTTIYPLCTSAWCLNRLRTTCTLWAFVRTGIVDKVWEEELPPPPPPLTIQIDKSTSGEKPPVPPRKRGLWGIASAIGERAASWSGDEAKEKARKVVPTSVSTSNSLNNPLPPPPPHHPTSVQPPLAPRRLPPPLPPSAAATPSVNAPAPPAATAAPPPLPRRSQGRARVGTASPTPPPSRNSIDNSTTIKTSTSPEIVDSPPLTTPPRKSVGLPALPGRSPVRNSHLRSQSGISIAVRSNTPSNVALPDSRPGTPSAPSRTSSPAIALQAAGGPPPPIPRRAAARARVVPAGDSGGSRPGTPSNTDAAAMHAPTPLALEQETHQAVEAPTEEEVGEKLEEVKPNLPADEEANLGAEDADLPSSVTPSSPAVHSDMAPISNHKADVVSPNRSTQPSPAGSDLFVDAPTPGAEIANPVVAAQEESFKGYEKEKTDGESKHYEDNATILQADNATIVDASVPVIKRSEAIEAIADENSKSPIVTDELSEEPIHINRDDAKEGDEAAADGTAADALRPEQVRLEEELIEKQGEKEKEGKQKEEKYKAGYVGDVTWEEKTWRELVRLREDMFWARIGGFRD